jgi:1,4-alpha-glucan branching enzyme
MTKSKIISVLLHAHLPFVSPPGIPAEIRFPDGCAFSEGKARQGPPEHLPFSCEESWFFEALSETYLPLLEMFDRLDAARVPFRLSLSVSPVLSAMLTDKVLIEQYLDYVDRQIEFGSQELDRHGNDPCLYALTKFYYDRVVEKRILFAERYEKNILQVLDLYQKKGRLEILTTAATHAFLPIYAAYPEAVQAQIEAAIASHRQIFGRNPHGFWLPEMGWSPELDEYLRSYNFSYTVIDTHGLLTGNGECLKGSFYPVKTPAQIFVLARDFYASHELFESESAFRLSPVYRDNREDPAFELEPDLIRPFLSEKGGRTPTGYKYFTQGGEGVPKVLYDPQKASAQARAQARAFLDSRLSVLDRAGALMNETPISLCAFDADRFGRFWYEGPDFLEALFREGAGREGLHFMNPPEYLFKQKGIENLLPGYSSSGINGYGEMWLDASNDWMYRHVVRSLDRMVELAERFPNDSGLKERALNQAAREILLVQSSDWPRMLYKQECPDFARYQIDMALRNFTTIYEALGSNYISTEWLTNLERRHNLFPHINYRVFRRKR